MLKDSEPIFIPDKYTKYGKWMDGWETRRKRIEGHDWSIVQLGTVSVIKGITVDTAHFTGNYAPKISIQAKHVKPELFEQFPPRLQKIGTASTEEEFEEVAKLQTDDWIEILPMVKLNPGYDETRKNYFKIDSRATYTHLRVNIYPDGGIARLRVYGDVQPNLTPFINNNVDDLIALKNGGKCLGHSNAHFGHPKNLIKSSKGINMGDGWETARRLDRPPVIKIDEFGILKVPGSEWAVFKMCERGLIESVLVDTNHFKGNFPDNVKLEGADIGEQDDEADEYDIENQINTANWTTIFSPQKLGPDREHIFDGKVLRTVGPFTHIRVSMAPDGGISRLRVFGTLADNE